MNIFITAFEPFGDSPINNSMLVSDKLKELLLGKKHKVESLVLPVEYDVAAQKAIKYFHSLKFKPDCVISLGQAPPPAKLRLETMAHNLDTSVYPDNAGVVRLKWTIEDEGPESIAFDFPVNKMFNCLNLEQKDLVEMSTSCGGYVCNNTAYLLSNYFTGLKIPYTFIHVPNFNEKDPTTDPIGLSSLLFKMLTLNLK